MLFITQVIGFTFLVNCGVSPLAFFKSDLHCYEQIEFMDKNLCLLV